MSSTGETTIADQEKRIKEKMSHVKNKLIVMSGKGGVGKTSVAVNLAYALSLVAKKTAILDIDVHGPNIAKMLGIENKTLYSTGEGIEPVEVAPNLSAVSTALAGGGGDSPVIWRGPMKTAVIRQLLAEVNWGELDYMIIDSPPGTGDEPLSVCQLIPGINGAVIVTTPQDVAVMDARKSIKFAQEIGIPVVGVIENMSGFICPHCSASIDIFKKGGGEKAATELGVPFLGRIPFDPEVVHLADKGTPLVTFQEISDTSRAFMEIVTRIRFSGGV